MMEKIRKIENISEVSIPVEIDDNTTVYLPPKKSMENISVKNLDKIKIFSKITRDLTEVNPQNEGKQKLYD